LDTVVADHQWSNDQFSPNPPNLSDALHTKAGVVVGFGILLLTIQPGTGEVSMAGVVIGVCAALVYRPR
jgi:hypothetical protein